MSKPIISKFLQLVINTLMSFLTLVVEGVAIVFSGVLLSIWLIGFLILSLLISGIISVSSFFLPSAISSVVTTLGELFIVFLFLLGPVVVSFFFVVILLPTDDEDILPDPDQYSIPSVWLLPPLTVIALRPEVINHLPEGTASVSIGALLGVLVFRGFLYAYIHNVRAGLSRNPLATVVRNLSDPRGLIIMLTIGFAWILSGLQLHLLGYISSEIATALLDIFRMIPIITETAVGFFAVPLAITGLLVVPWLAVGCYGVGQATYRQMQSMAVVLETVLSLAGTAWQTMITSATTAGKTIVSLLVTTGKVFKRLIRYYILLRP